MVAIPAENLALPTLTQDAEPNAAIAVVLKVALVLSVPLVAQIVLLLACAGVAASVPPFPVWVWSHCHSLYTALQNRQMTGGVAAGVQRDGDHIRREGRCNDTDGRLGGAAV